jgi:cystathionine gamma-synthase
MDKATLCVHGGYFTEPTGAISVPIYQSATFKHPGINQSTGFDYSRVQNPTRQAVEQAVAALEGGADAIAYTSGMAAITNLMEFFSPGDHIIASEDLYGGAIRLFRNVNEKNGLTFSFLDTSDLAAVAESITGTTKAIFIETPTNPMMLITDISAVCEIVKPHGITVIVDNTFLTPYFLQPLKLGADIVVHSGTKFLCGHNDTLAGITVYKDAAIAEKARYLSKTTGACLSPFDAWLLLRGIKTLAIRMEKQQQNAFAVAAFLQTHKKVRKVLYAGLPSHAGYGILIKQAAGFGSMISFETDTHETLIKVLENVRIISFAESLGGVETLITCPSVQTHADVPLEEREKRGINDRLLRISLGIENEQDLIADLQNALG